MAPFNYLIIIKVDCGQITRFPFLGFHLLCCKLRKGIELYQILSNWSMYQLLKTLISGPHLKSLNQRNWSGARAMAVPSSSQPYFETHGSKWSLGFLPAVAHWRVSETAGIIGLYWWVVKNTTTTCSDFSTALAKVDGYPGKILGTNGGKHC